MCFGACSAPAPPVSIGEKVDGVITFYDGDGRGACSYDSGDSDFAAINAEQWAASAACGTCIEITAPKGKTVVRTVDLCPECKRGHLDLSRAAFNKLADLSLGRVNVTWQAVTCPVSGSVRLKMKDGSNPYWTAVQVRNSRRPVKTLEVKKGGTWRVLPRTDYNYFLDESGFGMSAVEVRITADDNTQVTGDVPSVQANAELEMAGQF